MLVANNLLVLPPKEIDAKEARARWRAWRVAKGVGPNVPLLTAPDGNSKMRRSGRPDYSLSLAPAYTSGHNVCANSTPTCRKGCVAFSGRGTSPTGNSGGTVISGRILKNKFLIEDRDAFCSLVKAEILQAVKKHGAVGCRLNAFSDIPWEEVAPWMLQIPQVTWYDYSKLLGRTPPPNYFLCYSASERTSDEDIVRMVKEGKNVAVIFGVRYRVNGNWQFPLPTTFCGVPVIDGDKVDTRYDDPRGMVVGLRIKGQRVNGEYLMATDAPGIRPVVFDEMPQS